MTEAEYEREIARLKMVVLSVEGASTDADGEGGYCPWCDAWVGNQPMAVRAKREIDPFEKHSDECPAFTPEGVVR